MCQTLHTQPGSRFQATATTHRRLRTLRKETRWTSKCPQRQDSTLYPSSRGHIQTSLPISATTPMLSRSQYNKPSQRSLRYCRHTAPPMRMRTSSERCRQHSTPVPNHQTAPCQEAIPHLGKVRHMPSLTTASTRPWLVRLLLHVSRIVQPMRLTQ
jgi:hypothetical protein